MTIDDEVKLLRQIVREIVDSMSFAHGGFDVLASNSLDNANELITQFDADDAEQRGEA